MRQERSASRQSGSALVTVLIILTMLLVFSAALTVVSVVGLQTMTDSEKSMRAYYLADTGVQVGIARTRIAGTKQTDQTFDETIDSQGGGSPNVTGNINTTSDPMLYKITGTGTFDSMQRQVEAHLRFTGGYSMNAAVALTFSTGTSITGGPTSLPVFLDNDGLISGKDHDKSGTELGDQSKAVYGLTTNEVLSGIPFSKSGTGTWDGLPDPTKVTTTSRQSVLAALTNTVQTTHDIIVTASTVNWDSADTGTYGTSTSPKIVYVDLGSNTGKLTMKNNFQGYGTLVIDVDNKQVGDSGPVLEMINNAQWTGIIIIRFKGNEADFEQNGNPAIKLQNNAQLIGGTELFFANQKVETTSSTKLVGLQNDAKILYSSSVVASAPGTGMEPTATVVSYRRL